MRPPDEPSAAPQRPFRVLPAVGPTTSTSGRGGEDGELRFLRCDDCGYWIHPPPPICPACLSRRPRGRGGVGPRRRCTPSRSTSSPGIPSLDPPYVVAIVELPEQDGLRLTTNIVGCEPDDVRIGMPVQVVFERVRRRVAARSSSRRRRAATA